MPRKKWARLTKKAAPPKESQESQDLETPEPEDEPKAPAGGCRNPECKHGEDLHYGSDLRWCNAPGCQCQALSK